MFGSDRLPDLPPDSECWLAPFDPKGRPCDGPLDRAHLIPKQRIRKRLSAGGIVALEDQGPIVWHPAAWVCGCRLHHGNFDIARTIRVPRSAIPARTEAYASLLGLAWSLDHDYGRPDGPHPVSQSPVGDDDESGVGGGDEQGPERDSP